MNLPEKVLQLFRNNYCVKIGFVTIDKVASEMAYYIVESKDGRGVSSDKGDEEFAKSVLSELNEPYSKDNSQIVLSRMRLFVKITTAKFKDY